MLDHLHGVCLTKTFLAKALKGPRDHRQELFSMVPIDFPCFASHVKTLVQLGIVY